MEAILEHGKGKLIGWSFMLSPRAKKRRVGLSYQHPKLKQGEYDIILRVIHKFHLILYEVKGFKKNMKKKRKT